VNVNVNWPLNFATSIYCRFIFFSYLYIIASYVTPVPARLVIASPSPARGSAPGRTWPGIYPASLFQMPGQGGPCASLSSHRAIM